MRYQISSEEYLIAELSKLNDDYSLPWDTYPCMEWPRNLQTGGYGSLHFSGRATSSHRAAYTQTHGEIPPGIDICHQCDNPPCFRPIHLFPGTRIDNIADSIQKGRLGASSRHYKSKLNSNQVEEIRRLYGMGIRQADLMRKFKSSRATICRIVNHKRYLMETK